MLPALAVAALLFSACGKTAQITKEPGSTSDAAADAPPDGPGPDATAKLVCPTSARGPGLVLLPAPDGSKYCMDARETTRGEYDAFIAAKNSDTSGQPPACAWNQSYSPFLWDPNDPNNDTNPPNPDYCDVNIWTQMQPDQAVGCVDFCDALAYCQWAGKRLCGRVGGSKWGAVYDTKATSVAEWGNLVEGIASSTDYEFMNACTQGGKTKYPYGDSYEPGVCIDGAWLDAGQSKAITDLSSRQCHGTIPPFDGVYDLVGSAAEWQNICWLSQPGQESCLDVGYSGACGSDIGSTRLQLLASGVGIRCCADPVPAAP